MTAIIASRRARRLCLPCWLRKRRGIPAEHRPGNETPAEPATATTWSHRLRKQIAARLPSRPPIIPARCKRESPTAPHRVWRVVDASWRRETTMNQKAPSTIDENRNAGRLGFLAVSAAQTDRSIHARENDEECRLRYKSRLLHQAEMHSQL